jgi:hypothetical protein
MVACVNRHFHVERVLSALSQHVQDIEVGEWEKKKCGKEKMVG